ncbi:MAG: Holliday junction branch migration protein RuvA [Coriobacteriales bacterium]|nr:Holliday junction branch migration protein RuvA [Coriobacteriales bacterium]
MIAFLSGRIAGRGPGEVLLDVGGVGYRLFVTTNSLAALPADGDEITIWTHLHVREDELSLYGFESAEERSAFQRLITVSGVGPKVALGVLSALTPDTLACAVASEDVALLSSVPGIGKKTAQRLCLELRDKLGAPEGLAARSGAAATAPARDEAAVALLSMGFSSPEVDAALRGFEGDPADAAALVKHALKRLGAPA